jgi:hypothetical protein
VKPTYSNDRKAPRMRKGKFSKMIISKDLWRKFTKEFPEYKEMSWKDFYDNWLDIAETIRHETVNNPLGVKLGSYTGELKLQYLPHKFIAEDLSSSEEIGEKVNHLNITTRGKVAKIKWERRWAVKFNKMLQLYAFDETREINQMAKEYIDKHSDKLRVSRNTLGGPSIWRQKMNKND